MRKHLWIALVATVAALGISSVSNGAIIDLTASMDCAQANAGAGTCGAGGSGTGNATITLDTNTNLLSWNISWSGLSGTATLMHFHGPALPNQNAGVQVNTGVAGPPVIGQQSITGAQATDLLNGLWYLNLHSTTFTGGEIRGQVTVVPEPGTLALLAMGVTTVGLARRRRR